MFLRLRQSGFSLIELLITIATVSALSGIGLAVYAQYQQRAYNSTALQQGMNLRTSFEAGLSDRSTLGSTIFTNSPALEFAIDGTLSCVSGCDGITPSSLFPGYVADRGVKIFFDLFDSTQSYQIQVGHCKALTSDDSSYDGWRVSDQQASDRVAIPVDAGEVSQCSAVLAGGALSVESTPTLTPTAEPDHDCSDYCNSIGTLYCNGVMEGDMPSCGWNGTQCAADYSVCPNCGDGVCEGSETARNPTYSTYCPADCDSGPVCGNGSCEGGEDPMSCDADCGGSCGDSVCHPLEASMNTCPADCGCQGTAGNCPTSGTCSLVWNGFSCVDDCSGCPPFECAAHGCQSDFCWDGTSRCSCSSNGAGGCIASCTPGSGCPIGCGDGMCNAAEDNSSCPGDCPSGP